MTDSMSVTEVQGLVREGWAALHAGDTYQARKYFRQATEQDGANIEAWVGLADSVLPYQEKQEYLRRALALNPSHAEVRTRLDDVEHRLAAGEVLSPRQPARTAPPPLAAEAPAPSPATNPPATEATEVERTFCYRHPDRETGLRCTQCGTAICTECARPAFVGQLCPDCARERRQPNYQVTPGILAVAAAVSLVMSTMISLLVQWFFGGAGFFFIIALLIAPMVARLMVRVLDYITRAGAGERCR
ncbi:MAG: hypothetical protein HC884_09965 [Chloroflexaceae bacterium]|nr:hypothetical protein [Chloroflexaceae bacterium]